MEKKYFGESAFYDEGNNETKEEARKYLEFWKKNLIFKLERDSFKIKILDEQWGERISIYSFSSSNKAYLYLKIFVEADFNYELGKLN